MSMKIWEVPRGIVKRMLRRGVSTSRLRMALFFIAGMAVTAALSQTPVAADIFYPQVIHEPVVPTLPDAPNSLKAGGSPDTCQPERPRMSELVYAPLEEAALPC